MSEFWNFRYLLLFSFCFLFQYRQELKTNLYFDVIYSFNEQWPFDCIHDLNGNLCSDLPYATKKKKEIVGAFCFFFNEATLFINLYYGLGLVRSMHVYKWTHHCKVTKIPLKSEWLTERFLKSGKNYVISLFSNEQPSPLKCVQLHVCISGISTFPGNRLQPFLHVPLDKWCSVIQLSSSSVLPLPSLSFRLKEYLNRLYFGCICS